MAAKAKKMDVWTHNFATNEETRDMVRKVFLPKIREVRAARLDYEDQWIRHYNAWNLVHDDAHLYMGRAKLYVPEMRKNVEAQSRAFVDAAFPSDDYVDCLPGHGGTRTGAAKQKALRLWQIENAQLPLKYHVFSRQQCLYGTSPAYVCWTEKMEHVFKSARDPKTGKIKPTRQLAEIYRGPDFIPRDLFKWYAINPKDPDFTDSGCFDVRAVFRDHLIRQASMGMLYGLDQILEGNSDAYSLEELNKDILRAESVGIHIFPNQSYAGTASLVDEDRGKNGSYMETTLYAKIKCPEACLEGEDPELAIPMKIVVYSNEFVAFVGRNPFFHQRPPYLVGRYSLPNPDEFYGQGIGHQTRYQQYELNSKAEQCMDSVTYALQPIAMIDPAMAAQDGEFEIEPGAKWFVSPSGVRLDRMPDVSGTGYQAMSILKAQMQDYSDRTPSLPPELAGKARTATQAQIVNNVVSVDIRAFQRQNELQVLEPLMSMWDSLTDQNAEDDQMIMILGRDSSQWQRTIVSKNAMVGHYKYFWRVSTTLNNKQLDARQILDGMKIAGSLPPDQQQKLGFNFAEAFRRLWTDYWNLPDANKLMSNPDGMVSQDPETIIKMLELGLEVEVLPADDDVQIIKTLLPIMQESKDGWLKDELFKQIVLHEKQLQAKRQEAMRQHQLMVAQMQLQTMQQQGPPQGQQKMGPGNRAQLSPNTSIAALASGQRA